MASELMKFLGSPEFVTGLWLGFLIGVLVARAIASLRSEP